MLDHGVDNVIMYDDEVQENAILWDDVVEENAKHSADEGTDDRLPNVIVNMCAGNVIGVKEN